MRFRQNGTGFEREIFASHADDAIIIRLHADKPGALELKPGESRNLDGNLK